MHQHGCAAQICYLFVVNNRQRITIRLKHILMRVIVEAPDHDTCQKYVSQVVEVIEAQGYGV